MGELTACRKEEQLMLLQNERKRYALAKADRTQGSHWQQYRTERKITAEAGLKQEINIVADR